MFLLHPSLFLSPLSVALVLFLLLSLFFFAAIPAVAVACGFGDVVDVFNVGGIVVVGVRIPLAQSPLFKPQQQQQHQQSQQQQ